MTSLRKTLAVLAFLPLLGACQDKAKAKEPIQVPKAVLAKSDASCQNWWRLDAPDGRQVYFSICDGDAWFIDGMVPVLFAVIYDSGKNKVKILNTKKSCPCATRPVFNEQLLIKGPKGMELHLFCEGSNGTEMIHHHVILDLDTGKILQGPSPCGG